MGHQPWLEFAHSNRARALEKRLTAMEARAVEAEQERDAGRTTLWMVGKHLSLGGPETETDRTTLIQAIEAAVSGSGKEKPRG